MIQPMTTDDYQRFDASKPSINEQLADHHCFGCGDLNPIGLQLRFRRLPEGGVWARFETNRNHEGYLGMLHGGILSTMMDEAMSWAVTDAGLIGVTGRMSVAFRRPARVGAPLIVTGKVVTERRRVIEAAGSVIDEESGDVIAEAEARFVRVSPEQAEAWQSAYGAPDDSSFGRAVSRTVER